MFVSACGLCYLTGRRVNGTNTNAVGPSVVFVEVELQGMDGSMSGAGGSGPNAMQIPTEVRGLCTDFFFGHIHIRNGIEVGAIAKLTMSSSSSRTSTSARVLVQA